MFEFGVHPVFFQLKLQPRLARRVRQRLDFAMIQFAAAVKHHLLPDRTLSSAFLAAIAPIAFAPFTFADKSFAADDLPNGQKSP